LFQNQNRNKAMRKIELTPDEKKFLINFASTVMHEGKTWYYIPFWIAQDSDGFKICDSEKLPEDFKKHIVKMREGKSWPLGEKEPAPPVTEEKLWVECVDDSDHSNGYLTLGKRYAVIKSLAGCYAIIDDTGERRGYEQERFKLVDPPQEVGSEKWVVAKVNHGKPAITKDKKYLVYKEDEYDYFLIDDRGDKGWYKKSYFTPCDPPTKGESESESSEVTKVSELLNQFRSLIPVLNEIGNGVRHVRIHYRDCEVIFDVNDGAVVINPFETK
jgi:hypothetical protein